MVWLALILRGGRVAGAVAAVVLLLAMGLHQWHFPILFAGPFILWLFWSRRWGMALTQAGALGAGVVIWAKLWPMLLAHLLGPPLGGAARGAPEVDDKVASLFGRLTKWQPLLNIGRLIAWNNALLLPLGALSLAKLPRSLSGFATALYQGYGWGFRYMHGSVGVLCLLAGYGWSVLSPDGKRPLRLVWAATAISLIAAAWQLVTTEQHVRPYARTMAAIRASEADVVLVDLRGGYFMTDLVRFDEGRLTRPAVMALSMMDLDEVRTLCATHRVAIMDHEQFWALGVHPVNPLVGETERLNALNDELDALHCVRPIVEIIRRPSR